MQDKRDLPLMVVLYINAFAAAFNNNVINIALTALMGEYAIDYATAQWAVSGFMIATVVTVIAMAFVYRRFPLRKVFAATQGLFIAGGLLGLIAPSFAVLMVGRILQGAGVGFSMPMMANTVLIVARNENKGFMLAIGSTIITLAPALAPTVSGLLVGAFGWHSVFVPGLALAVLLLLAAIKLLRDVNEPQPAHFDFASAALLVLGLVPFCYALTRIVAAPLQAVGFGLVGFCILGAFVVRQNKLGDPFLNLQPIRSIDFWPACLMITVILMTTFSITVVFPLYLQSGLGLSSAQAGVVLFVPVIFNTICALSAGKLVDRFGPWPLIPIGFLLIAVGNVCLVFATGASGFTPVIVAGCLCLAGVGLTSSPTQTTALLPLDRRMYPHGVSLMTSFIQLAGCIAPPLYVGVLNAVQAGQEAAGVAAQAAVASGSSAAYKVALVLSIVATCVGVVYCWRMRKY